MYPHIEPYKKIWLSTDPSKKIQVYVEFSGNPKGIPVIYCHGGPGDHVTPRIRRLFKPDYNIILFDQRGCGNSRPLNHLERNTTSLLISDMEAIRTYVGCEKMLVTGGSWGSSLALLYAQKYPQHTSGLILRGIYDLSTTNCAMDSIYPEKDAEMKKLLGLKTKSDKEMYRKTTSMLNSKTKKRRKLIQLLSNDDSMYVISKKPSPEEFKVQETLSIVGNHYEKNHYFVDKNAIYKNMHKIKHIPTIMVEGRYDIVTPMKMAYKLSKKMDNCELLIVRGGHSSQEHAITMGLIRASNKMHNLV